MWTTYARRARLVNHHERTAKSLRIEAHFQVFNCIKSASIESYYNCSTRAHLSPFWKRPSTVLIHIEQCSLPALFQTFQLIVRQFPAQFQDSFPDSAQFLLVFDEYFQNTGNSLPDSSELPPSPPSDSWPIGTNFRYSLVSRNSRAARSSSADPEKVADSSSIGTKFTWLPISYPIRLKSTNSFKFVKLKRLPRFSAEIPKFPNGQQSIRSVPPPLQEGYAFPPRSLHADLFVRRGRDPGSARRQGYSINTSLKHSFILKALNIQRKDKEKKNCCQKQSLWTTYVMIHESLHGH